MIAKPIRLAVVGLGKIAWDQHLPAIRDDGRFVLAATVSPEDAAIDGTPHRRNLDALFAEGPTIDAVVLCTPAQVRYELAARALAYSRHVFLEKPPTATLSEVAALRHLAANSGAVLFAGWHSRFAGGVAAARAWLAHRTVTRASIVWREDVRRWHPGQAWIWEPGGFGVFDPGINALSIATHILPLPLVLRSAVLEFPSNRSAPIAAALALEDSAGAPVSVDFDWRQAGPQTWDIVVETDAGECRLSRGGAVLNLPDRHICETDREYAGLYARFSELIAHRRSDVDVTPLQIVADAFLRGSRKVVESFTD